jgi:aspartyl-tRNA(Asn)/glutamyl-tRNA(Gln) amidotransferase subunit C
MKISKNEVLHVANLARLELDEAGIEKLATQIGTILDYVDTLNQVDTTGVPPTSHAIFLSNAFREDELHQHLANEAALDNAPEKDEGAFLVPKVIE